MSASLLLSLVYPFLNKSSRAEKKNSTILNFCIDSLNEMVYSVDSSILLNKTSRERGERMPYNYSKLLGRIVERVGTQAAFAEKMERSERSISLKLNGKRSWTQPEIVKACEILGIQKNEIDKYFFAL